MKNIETEKANIAVIGLGYVGLPLALAFGKTHPTTGFDIKKSLVENCKNGIDDTGEVHADDFKPALHFKATNRPEDVKEADVIIVAVPTPIDDAQRPDLSPLVSASKIVGQQMKKGATIVYESTVFPGATEDICIPILEKESGFKWKEDFHVGYSPERINPGDKERPLTSIVKVVSGDTQESCQKIAKLYGEIIEAGVHPTATIKEAEAAKVIENTQRDLNIALINELAIIFDRLGIDTQNVLKAAGTKWNFLPFQPGLVGGHCIGVDPYYLTYKAQVEGYHPEVILSGRKRNDSMGKFIAQKTIKRLIQNGGIGKNATIAVLGLTFKEDCPDLRNTKVIDIIEEFKSYGVRVCVHDPMADPQEAQRYYGIELCDFEALADVDAVVVAVAHKAYHDMSIEDLTRPLKNSGTVIDVKSILEAEKVKAKGFDFWRL